MSAIVPLVLAGLALAAEARAEPGDLDPSFGGDGSVLTSVGTAPRDLSFEAVTVDGDERLVAVGRAPGFRFGVARFLESGALDQNFGGDGIVTTDLGDANYVARRDSASAVAMDASGRVLVGGSADDTDVGNRPAVARYLESGELDTSFGSGDGVALLPVDFEELGPIRAIVEDASGGILIGGQNFGVARLTEAGDLDPSFGDDGVAATVRARGLALDQSGRILAAGSADGVFNLARMSATGDPDPSFGGGDGLVTTTVGSNALGQAVAVGSDGKPVVAGSTGTGTGRDFALVRYDTAGAPDATFGGGDGIVVTGFEADSDDVAESVLVTAEGVVAAGTVRVDGNGDRAFDGSFALARYDASGALDDTFSGDGLVRRDITPSAEDRDEATDVAVGPDGDLVAAGLTGASSFGSLTTAVLARYRSSGLPDGDFGEDGVVLANPEGDSRELARAVMTDAQGRVVVAGLTDAGTFGGCEILVARSLPDGSPDPTFGGGDGMVTVAAGLADVSAAAIADDGSVVAIGPAGDTGAGELVRLTPAGDLEHVIGLPPEFGLASAVTFDQAGRVVVTGPADQGFRLVRATGAGELDLSFGGDGIADILVSPNQAARPATVLTDPLGRIVVGGTTFQSTPFEAPVDLAVARLTPEGAPDASFGGGDGAVITDLGRFDAAADVIVDGAGRLLAAGNSSDGTSSLVRYTSAGAMDPSFGGDGLVSAGLGRAAEFEGPAEALGLDASGRILVAGDTSFNEVDTYAAIRRDVSVARFMPSGSPDLEFGEAGFVSTDLDGRSDAVADLAVDPDGRLLVAGASATADLRATRDDDLALARYEAGPEIPLPDTRIGAIRVRSARASVRFRGTHGTARLRFRCVLDGETAEPCLSSKRYRRLSRGRHVVTVRAVDAAGRVDPTPARRAFRIRR